MPRQEATRTHSNVFIKRDEPPGDSWRKSHGVEVIGHAAQRGSAAFARPD
jgi:hypothetical protein